MNTGKIFKGNYSHPFYSNKARIFLWYLFTSMAMCLRADLSCVWTDFPVWTTRRNLGTWCNTNSESTSTDSKDCFSLMSETQSLKTYIERESKIKYTHNKAESFLKWDPNFHHHSALVSRCWRCLYETSSLFYNTTLLSRSSNEKENCMKNDERHQGQENINRISQKPPFGLLGHGEKDGKQKAFFFK